MTFALIYSLEKKRKVDKSVSLQDFGLFMESLFKKKV